VKRDYERALARPSVYSYNVWNTKQRGHAGVVYKFNRPTGHRQMWIGDDEDPPIQNRNAEMPIVGANNRLEYRAAIAPQPHGCDTNNGQRKHDDNRLAGHDRDYNDPRSKSLGAGNSGSGGVLRAGSALHVCCLRVRGGSVHWFLATSRQEPQERRVAREIVGRRCPPYSSRL